MVKIQYTDMISFIRSIDKLKSLRLAYQRSFKHTDIHLYGESGLLTNWACVESFYRKYLIGIDLFDRIVQMVLQDIEEINEQDLDNGYIPKDDYRDLVLSICSYIEKLDLFVSNYFSGSTLLQFINLTFNTDSLMFNVQYYYSDIVWEFIPDHSKQDIREGARGLIVSTPTSSAFMFLRGLEGCLRKLCEKLKYPYPTNKLTFGSAIQFLEKYYSERDDDRIIRQISF